MTNAELHAAWPAFIDVDGCWKSVGVTAAHQNEGQPREKRWCRGSSGTRNGDREERHEHRGVRLEKLDSVSTFNQDEDAWLYVWSRAAEGGELCRAYLLYLRHKGQVEYNFIREYCLDHQK